MSKINIITDHFKIMVGERGTDHFMGKLQKATKITNSKGEDILVVNSVLDGPVQKGQPITGQVMFPNYIQAWGRRVVKGKERADGYRVEISDKDYVGEVEWLTYGDEKGYVIYARYVKGQASLDYQYQVTRLGLYTIENERNVAYLQLPTGENDVFPSNDLAWATFIQIHYMNIDSLCRNPEATTWMYKMVKKLDVKSLEAKRLDSGFEAMKIVKEAAGSFRELEILKIILEKRGKIEWNGADENDLYDSLIIYAQMEFKSFHESVNDYKRNISELLSLCESYEAIDTSANGMVVVLKPKKEMLIEEVPVKGKDLYDWLLANSMKPTVYDALEKLTQISKTFK